MQYLSLIVGSCKIVLPDCQVLLRLGAVRAAPRPGVPGVPHHLYLADGDAGRVEVHCRGPSAAQPGVVRHAAHSGSHSGWLHLLPAAVHTALPGFRD